MSAAAHSTQPHRTVLVYNNERGDGSGDDSPSDNEQSLYNDHSNSETWGDSDTDADADAEAETHPTAEPVTPSKRTFINGVYLSSVAVSFVLVVNIILFAVAAGLAESSKNRPLNEAYDSTSFFAQTRTIYQGSCTTTKRWNIGLHFLINLLSTAILAASNNCMQAIVAPTRSDIDRAHAQGRWLDIGVPSMRNLFAVNKSSFLIWAVLMITTTPFHLLYNSAVFDSTSTNEYAVIIAPSDIQLTEVEDNLNYYAASVQALTALNDSDLHTVVTESETSWTNYIKSFSHGTFRNLTKEECVDTYTQDFLPGLGTVIVLSDDLAYENQNNNVSNGEYGSLLFGSPGEVPYEPDKLSGWASFKYQNSYGWLCEDSGHCTKADIKNSTDNLKIFDYNPGTFFWTFHLPSSNSDLATFYAAVIDGKLYGNFSLGISQQMDISNPTYNKTQQFLSWIGDTVPSNLQQINDYLRNNTLDTVITDVGSLGIYFHLPDGSSDGEMWANSLDGCLSQTLEENCQLLYNPPICITIILSAAIKAMIVFLAARLLDKKDTPLLTVGDAVASFLTRPDLTTAQMCWMGRPEVSAWTLSRRKVCITKNFERGDDNFIRDQVSNGTYSNLSIAPKELPKRKLLVRAVSWWRWGVTFLLCGASLGTASYFLTVAIGINGVSDSNLHYLWSLGFGSVQSNNIIFSIAEEHPNLSTLELILIANSPQFIMTCSYYAFNSVLTGMLAASECNSYGIKRKALRVSFRQPGGVQRRTYWFSIPYQYSIPLLIIFIILHWLISQSFFYVQIEQNGLPSPNTDAISTLKVLGYSPMAIILTLIVGSLMVVGLVLIAVTRRFASAMPLVASCSAAISSQCHHNDNPETIALGPVMWGETKSSFIWATISDRDETRYTSDDRADTPEERERSETEGYTAHCGFSSAEVSTPKGGKLYA
ncbi:hypothetical protein B7463_g12483, partial [Scytalidium lignicola]